MIANGASKCDDSIKDPIKKCLQAKIYSDNTSNQLFEAGVLLELSDDRFKEKYQRYFNQQEGIDLHGLNSDCLPAVLDWMHINGVNCFCKEREVIFGQATHTIGHENKMKEVLTSWLDSKKFSYKDHPYNKGRLIITT